MRVDLDRRRRPPGDDIPASRCLRITCSARCSRTTRPRGAALRCGSRAPRTGILPDGHQRGEGLEKILRIGRGPQLLPERLVTSTLLGGQAHGDLGGDVGQEVVGERVVCERLVSERLVCERVGPLRRLGRRIDRTRRSRRTRPAHRSRRPGAGATALRRSLRSPRAIAIGRPRFFCRARGRRVARTRTTRRRTRRPRTTRRQTTRPRPTSPLSPRRQQLRLTIHPRAAPGLPCRGLPPRPRHLLLQLTARRPARDAEPALLRAGARHADQLARLGVPELAAGHRGPDAGQRLEPVGQAHEIRGPRGGEIQRLDGVLTHGRIPELAVQPPPLHLREPDHHLVLRLLPEARGRRQFPVDDLGGLAGTEACDGVADMVVGLRNGQAIRSGNRSRCRRGRRHRLDTRGHGDLPGMWARLGGLMAKI